MLKCLRRHAQEADHPGLGFTRLAQDTFQIDTLTGSHHCIVTKLQGASIRTLQEVLPNAKLPKLLVKSLIHRLFVSVNWLHATCGLIHTGMLLVEPTWPFHSLISLLDIFPQIF